MSTKLLTYLRFFRGNTYILLLLNSFQYDKLHMTFSLKRNKYLQDFQLLNHDNIKYQVPIILRIYGALNIINLKNENRYILCNFLDQNSETFNLNDDIYITNNKKSLNQLFLLALTKAKKHGLLNALYGEYLDSLRAISQKKEFQDLLF